MAGALVRICQDYSRSSEATRSGRHLVRARTKRKECTSSQCDKAEKALLRVPQISFISGPVHSQDHKPYFRYVQSQLPEPSRSSMFASAPDWTTPSMPSP
ncbi:hypothetical protein OE88DRAFT_57179 [Heliocybe sulcata]|uniref:Uncharacterized protein n=1 Tax=Heliocybe sulcata TaxID=5364 RepID=A0A5C3NIX7_9AGAM|nr:hypothetical protein OE88DRAFT_57179 [Heliocybe sulcata]